MFQKVRVHPYEKGNPENEYSKLLTSYAFTFIIKQMKLVLKVQEIKEDGEQYFVESSEGKKVISLSSCSCIFQTSMRLPCRHMFALRAKQGKPLFDPSICDKRWTADYYRSSQRLFSTQSSESSLAVVCSSTKEKRKLSQHEKCRKGLLLTSELASVASVSSNIHFDRRMKLLRDLIDYWKCGTEVGLVEIDEGNLWYKSCILYLNNHACMLI